MQIGHYNVEDLCSGKCLSRPSYGRRVVGTRWNGCHHILFIQKGVEVIP